mgnify:FL=1
MIKNSEQNSVKSENDSRLLPITDQVYSFLMEKKFPLFCLVIILVIITVVSPFLPTWAFRIEAETLRSFFSTILGALITVIVFLGTLTVGLFSISDEKKDIKKSLWQKHIVRYLRYYFLLTILSISFLVFSDLMILMRIELFFVLVEAVLVIVGIFYLIKVTQRAFDDLFPPDDVQ